MVDDLLAAMRANGVDPADIIIGETTAERAIRKAIVRALTAQAWAVACMAFDWTRDGDCRACGFLAEDLANLPAPADLAAELLR